MSVAVFDWDSEREGNGRTPEGEVNPGARPNRRVAQSAYFGGAPRLCRVPRHRRLSAEYLRVRGKGRESEDTKGLGTSNERGRRARKTHTLHGGRKGGSDIRQVHREKLPWDRY